MQFRDNQKPGGRRSVAAITSSAYFRNGSDRASPSKFCVLVALLVLFSVLPFAAVHALTGPDILFYAPLDGTLEARIARGSAKPAQAEGEIKFVEGRVGQGLLTGGPGEVRYSSEGNVDLDAGAISVWVKAVDWKTDGYMRFFVRLEEAPVKPEEGAGNFAWLYKFCGSSVYWLVQQEYPFRKTRLVRPATGDGGGKYAFEWEQGKWGHLLATWSGNQLSLYINGNYCGVVNLPTARLMRKLGTTFVVGGQNTRGNGTPDTVLDELIILRTPVNPEEAKRIHEQGIRAFDQPSAPTAPLVEFKPTFLLSSSAVKFDLSLVGVRPDALQNWAGGYTIEGAADPSKRLAGEFDLREVHSFQTISVAALPDGAYRARVAVKQDGHEVAAAEGRFEKSPAPKWLGNTVGIETDAPAPWTPIERSKNILSCWGRTYAWENEALPVQIATQGQKLLARPVTLRARIAGQDVPLRTTHLIWNQVTPPRAEFTAVASLKSVPVVVRGWMEFDGFAWADIVLLGDRFATDGMLDSLALEVPMAKEAVPLMHGRDPIPWMDPNSGKTAPFHGKLESPQFWFGNEKGGLQIATRDFRDWQTENRSNMVSLSVEKDEAILRFLLIDHPTRVVRPLRYSLGLQATPVRPMPKGWRSWELELGRVNTSPTSARKAWMFFWEQWARIGNNPYGPYGYPVPTENTWKELEGYQKGNWAPWLYWLQQAVWLGDPVIKTMGGEWAGCGSWSGDDSGVYLPDAKPFDGLNVNHDLASVRDYMVWTHHQLFKENPKLAEGIRGIYCDMPTAQWQEYAATDSGALEYVFTLLGTRELQKRFYRMVKKDWPHLLLASHISGDPHNMSQYAFTEMMISGEHLTAAAGLGKEHNYHHVLSLDLLRAEYYGPKFGVPVVFLPEITRAVGDDEQALKKILGLEGIPAAEHLYGLLWIHDIIPWPADLNTNPFDQGGRVKDAFGWDDETRFHGYWENENLARLKSNQSPVVASLFTRPGKALFVVMNDSDTDAEATLAPDWKALALAAPAQLIDAYAEQGGRVRYEFDESIHQWKPVPKEKPDDTSTFNVPVKDGAATFTVKARNFRALEAR